MIPAAVLPDPTACGAALYTLQIIRSSPTGGLWPARLDNRRVAGWARAEEGWAVMKLHVIALAGALLALTAAAAQATPATVVPDAVHAIGRDAKQVVNGTGKGVSDQYHHTVAAARRTGRDARRGALLRHRRHHHHHLVRRVTHTHTVETHTG